MTKNFGRTSILGFWVLSLMPLGGWAFQADSISLSDGDIVIRDSDGNIKGWWNDGDDLWLGGGGDYSGDLLLTTAVGDTTIWVNGAFGDLTLGGPGQDGDIYVRNGSSISTVVIDGNAGTLTNSLGGNGLVKAWARINSDGTIASCWKCNTSTAETQRYATGEYEVDFTPLGNDISARPWLCSVGHGGVTGAPTGQLGCVKRTGDPSSVWVAIEDDTGASVDRPFTLIIF